MTSTVVACLQSPGPMEEGVNDDTEEFDKHYVRFEESRETVNDLNLNEEHTSSSSAHTDSENEAEEELKRNFVMDGHNRVMRISDTNFNDVINEDSVMLDTAETKENIELLECPENMNLLQPIAPARNMTSLTEKGKQFHTRRKKISTYDEVLSHSSSEDDEYNRNSRDERESYPAMKMTRKNLLKIDRLTDSDSRGRDDMRRRGLSPPSSSDEENLHIGWVAYATGMPKRSHIQKTNVRPSQHRQRALCACVDVLKCLISPMTKVCKICRGRSNKVWNADSITDRLLNGSDTVSEEKKNI